MIRGFIGEVHQKDKLSYISLFSQIEEGTDKGYLENEVVSAVIRAFAPGIYLRNILENTDDLTLKKVDEVSSITLFGQKHNIYVPAIVFVNPRPPGISYTVCL